MCEKGHVEVGQEAPHFSSTAIVDGRFKELSSSDYTEANHWLVLVFFPRAWSFICPSEIRAFSTRLEEFLYSRSCAIVFVSTDSAECLRAWNATSEMEGGLGGVHLPLLSNCNHTISRKYGVLIEDQGVAQRALFIIDPHGIVRAITINDADVGRSVDEAQRILDALAFKDEFGEGCPADWRKGDQEQSSTASAAAKHDSVDNEAQMLKKSWSEWARPKLQRAWSATSARSSGSFMDSVTSDGPVQHNPMMSPTSAAREGVSKLAMQIEDAMIEQRMRNNLEAAGQNMSVVTN